MKKKVKLSIIIDKKGIKSIIIDKTGSRIGSWKLRIFSRNKIKDTEHDLYVKDPDIRLTSLKPIWNFSSLGHNATKVTTYIKQLFK